MNVNLLRIGGAGTELAVLQYEARRSRGVSLVVGHGYSSSKHNLDFLCGFLAGHGYGAFSLDFPGHKLGASGGRLNDIDGLVAAMHSVVAYVRERIGDPIYTMGHSMGAMTALLTAAQDPAIAGVVAITTGWGRPTALDALARKGVTDFRASYVEGVPLPDLVCGVDEHFEGALPRLAGRPQLYVAAARDAMVSPRSVEELYRRASEPKTFTMIESDHTSAGENARGAVLQWLNALHPR